MSTRFEPDTAALQQLLEGPSGDVAKDLTRRAIAVATGAKRRCPVDTGRLRSSINQQVGSDSKGLVAVIGTNVVYAPFVELGTRWMRAQPFLRPALEAASR